MIVWQSETSPSHIRGLLVASALSFLILGQLIAYWLEYGTANMASSFSWRFPMAFQAVLAILTSVLLFFMPESPRWLFQHEYRDEATQILRLLATHKDEVDEDSLTKTVTEIADAIALESHQAGWRELLQEDAVGSRRRVILACILNACQAWSGSTPVSYYTTYM